MCLEEAVFMLGQIFKVFAIREGEGSCFDVPVDVLVFGEAGLVR